jgi:hypothetical protein
MLQKFFPEYFRDIPWQQTGKLAGEIKKASVPILAARKGVRVLKQLAGIQSTKGYTDYPAWIRDEAVAATIKELLNPETARYRLLTKDDLDQRWLQPHLSSRLVNNSNQILRIATLEIYLRKVFGEKSPNS